VKRPDQMQPMNKPINVLILEDRATDAELLLRELRRAGFTPTWKRVETEPDFLAEIKNLPDIILSDYAMPQFSGLRAAELLQKSGLNIPFILISGTVGEESPSKPCSAAQRIIAQGQDGAPRNCGQRALEQKCLRNGAGPGGSGLAERGGLAERDL